MRATEPFLKWAGGKRRLREEILDHLPEPARGRRYFEPFLGSGAVFFALRPPKAVLSDLNAELVEVFETVRDDVDGVIQKLLPLTNNREVFYAVRSQRPSTSAGRAARFIFLNKTCFNGLYRVNLRGEFNV